MPIYTVELDGKHYDLEGDRPPTEAEARAAVGQTAPQAEPPKEEQSTWDRLWNGPKEITDPSTGKTLRVMGSPGILEWLGPSTTGMDGIKAIGKVPGVIAKGLGVSKVRAGANIEQALAAAKDVPIDPTAAARVGVEMLRYKGKQNIPRIAQHFMDKAQMGPGIDALKAPEAQDFVASMRNLSSRDLTSVTPQMKRLLLQMERALRGDIVAAADTVGAGEQYTKGINEFRRASKAGELAEQAGPVAKKALKWLAGGAGLYGTSKLFD